VRLGELNWLGPPLTPGEPVAVAAKLRSAQQPVSATLHAGADGDAELVLSAPAGAVAPGQAAVLYNGDRLLGGGWIRRNP
jgi:tRNA-specific 2-thiouridylase